MRPRVGVSQWTCGFLDMTGLRRVRDPLREVVRVAEHAPYCARIHPFVDAPATDDFRRFLGLPSGDRHCVDRPRQEVRGEEAR